MSAAGLAVTLPLGLAVALGAPAAAVYTAERAAARDVQRIIRGDASWAKSVARLRWLRWADDLRTIPSAYEKETDPARRERLATAYRAVTGKDVEEALRLMRD